MSLNIRVLTVFLISTLVLSSNQSFAQTNNSQQETILLYKTLEKNHIIPKAANDSLSKEIFKNYLELLDPQHLYFTIEDYKSLSKFELSLDDELKGQGWKFLPFISNLYKVRLKAAASICESFKEKPFNLNSTENLLIASNDTLFAVDLNELSNRWSKWLRFQTLWQLVSSQSETATDKQLATNEADARKKAIKVELRKISRILEHPEGFDQYLANQYLNSITACFDPHTNYLSKTDLQNFQDQLSSESYSFGINLGENEFGDIEIKGLVPGGPAWKSNKLHKGDVLISMKWLDKPVFELVGEDLSEIENILKLSGNNILDLSVRSVGGSIKTVRLKKEKLRDDENIVNSFVIKGEKTVGYITLPGFYTDWNSEVALGCANDVAKEIVKLKKEKIDGLILDLRFNGGGSMEEGLSLASIFIDEGPLLIIQGKDTKAHIIRDMNRGTVYDGPLLVMVNGQSASASEIFASTLQDYNRALIVGSTTFGKSTSQTIQPLNESLANLKNFKTPYGFVKITQNKIYRVTGATTQQSGVQPDVYLPDVFEMLEYKESMMPNALSKDSINKKAVFNKLPLLPVAALQGSSKYRLLQHEGFKKIDSLKQSSSFKSFSEHDEIPLNISFFRSMNKDYSLWKSILTYTENTKSTAFRIENPVFNQVVLNVDTYTKELNTTVINNIQSDMYVEQSYFILLDMLKSLNK